MPLPSPPFARLPVRSRVPTTLLLAAIAAPAALVADAAAPPDAMRAATERFARETVIPAHEALAAASASLVRAGAAFERSPDRAGVEAFARARLEVARRKAASCPFTFGPTHALGLDEALDAPTDEAGVALTIDGLDEASAEDIAARRLVPSLTGLSTIEHLLEGAADDPAAVPVATRRYLHALARRVDDAAIALLAAWRDGHDGHPPFAETLATAGEAGNRAYRSVEGAAEEIVRGMVNCLDVVVAEELPAAADVASGAGSGAVEPLEIVRATVDGVAAVHADARPGDWSANAAVDASVDRLLGVASDALADAIAAVGANGSAVEDDAGLEADATAAAAIARAAAALEEALAALEAHVPERAAGAVAASAGDATSHDRTSSAYEAAPPNLTPRGVEDHDLGDEAFEEAFVQGDPHPTAGLGPTFNNTSCVGCHQRNGRGMPTPGQLLLRVSDSLPGGERALDDESDTLAVRGNTPPVEGIGNQIQDFGIAGVQPEARVDIRWTETEGEYPDGTPYRLRAPAFEIVLASTGELLPEAVRVSPRVPPHVYGLGLLEAVPEADIVALADPDDRDGDGISGRPNRVWDERLGDYALGRFGWKANSPNLLQQTADAYLNDMGIHSPLFPAEDGSVEIDEETLRVATAYSQTLAVPARRALDDPGVRRGEKLFAATGCTGCHVESFETGPHEYPALAGQTIRPYTDLLLHDMGDGLADGRPDFEADGREWRTPALWGIGLAQTVLPGSGYLHDGRARTFEEAILWHGGEAERARSSFEHLPAADRQAVVDFLRSL